MGRVVPLARHSLFHDRRRALLAVGGIAAGLLLVLLLSGIFSGFRRQASEYVDRSPAALFVSQAGVKTMHMSVSSLPDGTVDRVRSVPGVAWAEPLRYTGALVHGNGAKAMSYVIAWGEDQRVAGPRELVRGRRPGAGEVVLDEAAAATFRVDVGGTVDAFGTSLRVAGVSRGGTMAMNTTVFVGVDEFVRLTTGTVNFVLVGLASGVDPAVVTPAVAAAAPGTTVQTREAFAQQEAEVIDDTFTDMTRVMVGIGFVVAMALIALTLTTVTMSNLREFGVVKALGGSRRAVLGVVVGQALWAVAAASVVAVALAVALAAAISARAASLQVVLEPASVARTLLYALVVSLPAAALPMRRVLRVEPAEVFRTRT